MLALDTSLAGREEETTCGRPGDPGCAPPSLIITAFPCPISLLRRDQSMSSHRKMGFQCLLGNASGKMGIPLFGLLTLCLHTPFYQMGSGCALRGTPLLCYSSHSAAL